MADIWVLDSRGLDRWRAFAGQAGIDAWCRTHDIDPLTTPPRLQISDGEITGLTYLTDETGHRYFDPTEHRPAAVSFTRRLIAPPPPGVLYLDRELTDLARQIRG